MYKEFNVILAVFGIIIHTIIIVYSETMKSTDFLFFVAPICIFMLWLDGKIDYFLDEIKEVMKDKR